MRVGVHFEYRSRSGRRSVSNSQAGSVASHISSTKSDYDFDFTVPKQINSARENDLSCVLSRILFLFFFSREITKLIFESCFLFLFGINEIGMLFIVFL